MLNMMDFGLTRIGFVLKCEIQYCENDQFSTENDSFLYQKTMNTAVLCAEEGGDGSTAAARARGVKLWRLGLLSQRDMIVRDLMRYTHRYPADATFDVWWRLDLLPASAVAD